MPRNQTTLSIPSPEALITGDATLISPAETSALAAIEGAWGEARRLADLVKDYSRAGNAGKAFCGLTLSHLREHYFGPRSTKGGRPSKTARSAEGGSWESMLADKVGITDETASNWMKMAEAVQAIAAAQGLDLQATCKTLHWEWTPEEKALIDDTFQQLCKDKTQRQLLQADFLSNLGFLNNQETYGTNNPLGKNGGKKQLPRSPAAMLEERRILARLDFYGCEKAGSVKPGSPVWHIENFLLDPASHPLSSLTKPELLDLLDNTLAPFTKALRALIK